MLRRSFLSSLPLTALKAGRAPRLLLRGSWQSVNIGDIGHTPGALGILSTYFPEAEITLWPGRELGHGSRELLTNAFPKLKILAGAAAARAAWADTDLYVSGSGSGFPASADAMAFRKATGKPVGVLGVSLDPISGIGDGRDPEGGTLADLRRRALALPKTHLASDMRDLLDHCAFFFCRDTITRDYLKAQGVKTPILDFGPDAQLGMRLTDDAKGHAWLAAHGLEAGKFICVIPRLRYTPYYRVDGRARTPADDVRDAINDRTTEKDHAKLRQMITRFVESTGLRVMVCAEMTYQVEMGKQVLVDPLPPEIRKNVVWRDTYWLPDEAASIYAKALAVVSTECHSPLIAYRAGTPALYFRQPTDTCKGEMYRDFGAGDWLCEVDETTGEKLAAIVGAIAKDPGRARGRVKKIMATVETRQKKMAEACRRAAALRA